MTILEECNVPLESSEIKFFEDIVDYAIKTGNLPENSWGWHVKKAMEHLRSIGDIEKASLIAMAMSCMGQGTTNAATRSLTSLSHADMIIKATRNN